MRRSLFLTLIFVFGLACVAHAAAPDSATGDMVERHGPSGSAWGYVVAWYAAFVSTCLAINELFVKNRVRVRLTGKPDWDLSGRHWKTGIELKLHMKQGQTTVVSCMLEFYSSHWAVLARRTPTWTSTVEVQKGAHVGESAVWSMLAPFPDSLTLADLHDMAKKGVLRARIYFTNRRPAVRTVSRRTIHRTFFGAQERMDEMRTSTTHQES